MSSYGNFSGGVLLCFKKCVVTIQIFLYKFVFTKYELTIVSCGLWNWSVE